jgi:hypothetical protein
MANISSLAPNQPCNEAARGMSQQVHRWRNGLPRRLGALLVAGAVAVSAPALAYPAHAAPTTTVTRTFSSTGGEQTFIVPSGVTSLTVEAIGGRGGAGASSAAGGQRGRRHRPDLRRVGRHAVHRGRG